MTFCVHKCLAALKIILLESEIAYYAKAVDVNRVVQKEKEIMCNFSQADISDDNDHFFFSLFLYSKEA